MRRLLLFLSIISVCKADMDNVPLKYFNDMLALKNTAYKTAVLTLGKMAYSENINKYFLFTRSNPIEGEELIHGDVKSVKGSNFDKDKHTVFLSHGWFGYQSTISQVNTTNAILKKHDYNVIRVDWSKYSETNYVTCALVAMPKAASDFAEFLVWLNKEFGLCFNNVHLMGLSLGSHFMSIAACKAAGGAIKALTGFDPVKVLFKGNPSRMNKKCAKYVKIIHTTDEVGIYEAIGHVDFYFNGGRQQPQCRDSSCGHIISWRAFSASVEFPCLFTACECNSLSDVDAKTCTKSSYLMRGIDDEGPAGIYLVDGPLQYYPYKDSNGKTDKPKCEKRPNSKKTPTKCNRCLTLPKPYGLI